MSTAGAWGRPAPPPAEDRWTGPPRGRRARGSWSSARTLARLPVLALALGALACQGSSPCARPPVGSVTAFLEGEGPSASFTAAVVEIGAVGESGLVRYRLREPDGTPHVLVFRAPEESLPVRLEQRYAFELETVPGSPTPAALVVRDEQGLLYAGVSDYAPGERVLRHGLPGFVLALEASGCANRERDPGLATDANALLSVEHAGASVRLFHGDAATLGSHRVRCLAARQVTYRPGSADTGVLGVGYTLRRVQ